MEHALLEARGELIYALGVLGYDFGAEARHDSFKQRMRAPASPSDARGMGDYLAGQPYEAERLIWTLNLDLIPVYALSPAGPFARETYEALRQMLAAQLRLGDDPGYAERIGIPGRLTGETVQLLSGQTVPVVALTSPHSPFGWGLQRVSDTVVTAVKNDRPDADEGALRKSARSFPARIQSDLYDLRNLGRSSQDRALNFAVTHLLEATAAFSEAVAAGLTLSSMKVVRSSMSRMNSDCWDAVLSFFDPDKVPDARREYRFTLDVSDLIPVLLSPIRLGGPTGLISASLTAVTPSAPVQDGGSTPAKPAAPGAQATAPPTGATVTPPSSTPAFQLLVRGAESKENTDGSAYHFGAHSVGSITRASVFFIENSSARPINFDGKPRVVLAGSGADQFEVVKEPPSPLPPGGKAMFTIRFRPTSAGTKTAEVNIATDAPGRVPIAAGLMGKADAPLPAGVRVTAEELLDGGMYSFGGAAIGSQKVATFTLENPGSKPLVLASKTGVLLEGQTESFLLTTAPSATVAAASSTAFAITFKPRKGGTKLCLGRIDHDGEGSPCLFFMRGRADGVEIALKQGTTEIPSSGAYDFGETRPENPSTTVTFTIENEGVEALVLSGDPKVSISGLDAADFSVQRQPSSPVESEKSTQLAVTFAPKTAGQKQAQLKILNNDPDENPYLVQITGLSRSLRVAGSKRDRLSSDDNVVLYADKQGVVRYRNFSEPLPWREVPGLTNVRCVKAGTGPHYAIKTDGTVWAWTYTSNAAVPPKQVAGLADVVGMDVGTNFALFLKADGTVCSIGVNDVGQLGNGSTAASPTQVVKVSNLSNAVAVSTALDASFALLNDGTVWSWGQNAEGLLGNGLTASSSVPAPVPGLSRIVEICGFKNYPRYAMALRDDGVLWGWGTDAHGGLSTSQPSSRNFPVQITGVPRAKSVFMGRCWGSGYVVDQDGKLWSWGYDNNYRLGRAGAPLVPAVIPTCPASLQAYTAGANFVVVIDGEGKAWYWGWGQWASATQTAKAVPDLLFDG